MAGTSAQVEAMAAAAAHVDNAGRDLADIQGRIQAAVAATGSGYNSPAATLFRGVMDQWHQDFTTILNNLENIREKLTHTRVNYEGTMMEEQQSANLIAALLNPNGNTV